MSPGLTMLKRVLPLACAALAFAGSAQAALQDRDLDGDTVVDAYYDTDLDITWLRDANVNGAMNWETAASWADNFSLGAYNDWRLPTAADSCVGYYSCASSEMGHLWYVELGNSAGAMTNQGGFQDLLPAVYWSGTDYVTPAYAVVFTQSDGLHGWASKTAVVYAMAVRDGDIAAIPEPETYALMLVGLIGLALATRRWPR